MLIIGVTGSFGSGKTTVASMFKDYGALTIDADAITRQLLAPGGKCVKTVVKIFGHAILNINKINRVALAKIVFQDPRELKVLTNILYPVGLKEVKKQIAVHKNAKLIILDVPLLFESGWDQLADVSIVVQSNQTTQIKRLQKYLGLSKGDILRRIKCQMPLKEKLPRADIVIDNRGSLAQTRAQVAAIVHRLMMSRKCSDN
ncbi:MAG: dephospho-CoA kinase [Candidatus Omnitrophica bacterium]|nr:dephospho-CoA kinase [Candidatus Omnitrophota bacterium]